MIRLGESVGQRHYGHFDHDANCVTGPHPAQDSRVTESPLVEQHIGSHSGGAVLSTEINPVTGELMFRLRSAK